MYSKQIPSQITLYRPSLKISYSSCFFSTQELKLKNSINGMNIFTPLAGFFKYRGNKRGFIKINTSDWGLTSFVQQWFMVLGKQLWLWPMPTLKDIRALWGREMGKGCISTKCNWGCGESHRNTEEGHLIKFGVQIRGRCPTCKSWSIIAVKFSKCIFSPFGYRMPMWPCRLGSWSSGMRRPVL